VWSLNDKLRRKLLKLRDVRIVQLRERVSVQSHLGPKREIRQISLGTELTTYGSPFVVVQDHLAFRARTGFGIEKDFVVGGFSGELLDEMQRFLVDCEAVNGG
jgi:hypothetical protein